jgi:hypothetical protein
MWPPVVPKSSAATTFDPSLDVAIELQLQTNSIFVQDNGLLALAGKMPNARVDINGPTIKSAVRAPNRFFSLNPLVIDVPF